MRSHLTRNVCRRLLASHGAPSSPLAAASQPHIVASSPPRPLHLSHRPRPRSSVIRRPTRRTFFGIFQKPPRELKEPTVEPGYTVLLQFRSAEAEGHRLPPRTELVAAWRTFFDYKIRHFKAVNSSQAFIALRLLDHLQGLEGAGLGLKDLRLARDALLMPARDWTRQGSHVKLARRVYEEIVRETERGPQQEGDGEGDIAAWEDARRADFRASIKHYTLYGGSVHAAKLVEEHWRSLQQAGAVYKGANYLWVLVFRGLAGEGNEEKLQEVWGKAQECGIYFMPAIHEIMVTYYASRDRVEETKEWFGKPIYGGYRPLSETYLQLLKFAVRNGEQEWVKPIFEELRDSKPTKALWDVIFQWAVLAEGKGVDDVRHMMETAVYNSRNTEERPIQVDIGTINQLIEVAIEKKDPYLAERFITVGSEMGIAPNSRTYLLQMEYRIEAKDFSGAGVAYKKLETSYITDDEDVPMLNKYIRALCQADKPDVERILEITRNVEERNAQLEPETVASLCMVFLKADQEFEVMDTLSLHAIRFSLEERARVEKALLEYCLDRNTSTARAWDTYSLVRQFFPETEATDRIRLMESFFDRKRPDMACYVFGHMRAADTPSHRPTKETYIQCLEGLGRCPDAESLKMVHNMLKMDTTVQPDTRVYNALMIAYLSCGDPGTAYDFWSDISHSIEGPTYNSLAIVFRVCENMPFGFRRAQAIWEKMQRMDLDVPGYVFAAYCGAMAGRGSVEELKKVITGGGGEVDLMT